MGHMCDAIKNDQLLCHYCPMGHEKSKIMPKPSLHIGNDGSLVLAPVCHLSTDMATERRTSDAIQSIRTISFTLADLQAQKSKMDASNIAPRFSSPCSRATGTGLCRMPSYNSKRTDV